MRRKKRVKKPESEKIAAQTVTLPAVIEDRLERVFSDIRNVKKRRWLAAIAATGRFMEAQRLTGIDRRFHYLWRDKDPDYPAAFEKAREIACDMAEDCVFERAFTGYDKPVTYEGEITATYKQPSNLLAMFWLKGARPEKYREDSRLQINVNVPPAVNIVPPVIDVTEEKKEPLLAEFSAEEER